MELFKKKLEVPEELPDLKIKEAIKKPTNLPANHFIAKTETPEKGYFKEILDQISSNDASKLKQVHEKCSSDLVLEMKNYWSQQNSPLMSLQGQELRKKLIEKVNTLQMLEKEWQRAYFTLTDKEEKIRKEEAEVKSALAKLVQLYKSSKPKI